MTVTRTDLINQVATNPDPIDIIVTGYRESDAEFIGATVWDAEPCQFVDCYEIVHYSPGLFHAAIDVYFGRVDLTTHSDDQILVCCRDHDSINNAPRVVGSDIFQARRALQAVK